MGIRSLVLLSIVATAFSLAPSAHADVPNPTTSASGAGGSTGSGSGTGGAAAANDPNCLVSVEQVAGTTCQECDPTGKACSTLGSTYNKVCQRTATAQVWCNGPIRNVPQDQNVACSVAVPGGALGGAAAGGALAVAAALLMRRRRRS